ncbi:MAG: cupin domain-containing protein [Candidatus Paceibacterota bacterium]|jgi:mannose-6-phosphate isomerase-like protein (cupin superfamily)
MQFKISLKWFIIVISIVVIAFSLLLIFFLTEKSATSSNVNKSGIPMSYYTNIIKDTEENENFRRVLFTGSKSQLVVMSIPSGTDIGEETHKYTEQTLFFLSGTGEGELDGKKFPIGPGDVVVVVPGTKHNFRNTGTVPLKLYTVYAPPNHIDGRIHTTKADADSDMADEAIGETEPLK